MKIQKILLAATAALTLTASIASAQPGWVPPGNPPDGYYSDADHNGFYDRNGAYRKMRYGRGGYDRGYDRGPGPGPGAYDNGPPPPPPMQVRDCRRDNRTTGTILGAIAGGLIGNSVAGRHGDKTAGVIIGGAVGAVAGRAIDKGGNNCR